MSKMNKAEAFCWGLALFFGSLASVMYFIDGDTVFGFVWMGISLLNAANLFITIKNDKDHRKIIDEQEKATEEMDSLKQSKDEL